MRERLKKKKRKKCRYAQNETNTKRSSSNNNNTPKKKSIKNELAIKRHDSNMVLEHASDDFRSNSARSLHNTVAIFYLVRAFEPPLYSPLLSTFRKRETGHPWP